MMMEERFKMSMSEEGASKLADRLTENLKTYMGDDFVDDTLVKYVIVLLGNGRSKEEVKEDLDVFLGDNTHSFVTWLWDHLSSSLQEYVLHPPQSQSLSLSPPKPTPEPVPQLAILDSDKPKSRTRHNRDWKQLVTHHSHPPPLRSSITTLSQSPNSNSVSPQRPLHRKRPRLDDHPRPNVSQARIAAPRRLLQFAVRDAVATARPSYSDSIPAHGKRLKSVVSTPFRNSVEELHPQRIQSVPRPLNPMATAIRAVAEAAEDVRRGKSGNVFDRLSRGVDERSEFESVLREPALLETEYEHYDAMPTNTRETYVETGDHNRLYDVNASIMDSNTALASDSASDNEGYENVNVVAPRGTHTSRVNNKADDSLMVQYSVAQNTDEITPQSRKNGQEQSGFAASTKHKIVNISVNVNTWKPPHYQSAREKVEADTQKPAQKNTGLSNSNVKDNNNAVTVFGIGNSVDFQTENQKSAFAAGSYSTGRPLEDVDSRTIFVNNVHFAATKDTLSRHFNKFGEVLKVIILTDAATGHPKGSAYVEFMRKDAAENALTLDGTSFMSRIIKVVKKSSGQQEASPMMTWPRIARGSPYSAPRFAQALFPRVFPGAYRGRVAMKLGVRSMQWKRDGQQTSTESGVSVPGNTTNNSSAGRGLTYVRTESKSEGNVAGA